MTDSFRPKGLFLKPDQGALTQLYAAISAEVDKRDLKAAYLVPFGQTGWKTPFAQSKKLRSNFWALCERLVQERS
jgi:hypothetical protein